MEHAHEHTLALGSLADAAAAASQVLHSTKADAHAEIAVPEQQAFQAEPSAVTQAMPATNLAAVTISPSFQEAILGQSTMHDLGHSPNAMPPGPQTQHGSYQPDLTGTPGHHAVDALDASTSFADHEHAHPHWEQQQLHNRNDDEDDGGAGDVTDDGEQGGDEEQGQSYYGEGTLMHHGNVNVLSCSVW